MSCVKAFGLSNQPTDPALFSRASGTHNEVITSTRHIHLRGRPLPRLEPACPRESSPFLPSSAPPTALDALSLHGSLVKGADLPPVTTLDSCHSQPHRTATPSPTRLFLHVFIVFFLSLSSYLSFSCLSALCRNTSAF